MTTRVRAQKTTSADEGTPSLLPTVRLLMEGISRHSVKGDVEEFRKFRSQIQHILQSLDEDRSPHEAYDSADQAVGLLKDYGHRTSKRLGQQSVELHAVIKMLLDTFRDLAIAGPKGMRQLQELGGALASTSDGEKLAQCRLKLSECLSDIRQEAERFRKDADGRTIFGDARKDRLTGLESREVAEVALSKACAAETPGCAIIIIIDRIAVYNVRFGRAVGDKVLQFFADYLIQSLPSEGSPFRWSGPAVLMLRPGSAEQAAPIIRRVLEQRVEYEVELAARTILLPIAARWEVVPLMADPRLVVNKIDSIVAFQGVPGPSRTREH
jgi:GGDEF domain-containing protein